VWMKEKIIVILQFYGLYLCEQTGYFQYMQPQYLTFVKKSLLCNSNFPKVVLATVLLNQYAYVVAYCKAYVCLSATRVNSMLLN